MEAVKRSKTATTDRLLLKVLIGLLVGLNVLNWLAPVLSASTHTFARYLGAGIYFLLDPICHQLPDRCIYIRHVPMALCVRCTFIYLGALLGLIVLYRRKGWHLGKLSVYGILLFIFLEIGTEKLGLYANWFWLRGLSGFVLGLFVVLYLGRFKATQRIKSLQEEGKKIHSE